MLKRIILVLGLIVSILSVSVFAETKPDTSNYPDIPWTYTEGQNGLGEIIYAQNKYITAGYDGIKVSADLETWKTVVSVSGEQYIYGGWPAIEYNGSIFVVTGLDGGVYTSSDGEVWSFYERPFDFDISEIIWDGSKFVAVGQYGREKFQEDTCPAGIIVSPDGLNWETLDVQFDIPWGLNHIAYNGNIYVVDDIADIYYSYDLKNWKKCDVFYGYNEGIEWVSDRFIATRGYNNILYSYDGIKWQSIDQSWGNTMWACAYNGNVFVTVGFNGTIYVSYDGVNWICKTEWHRIDNDLFDVIWTGERFVILGRQNNLTWVPDDITKVNVNGNYLMMDTAPIIENGRTLVPLRAIFETLGAEVMWDEETQTISAVCATCKAEGIAHNITMKIGDPYLYSYRAKVTSGELPPPGMARVELDTPPILSGGHTLVPVRAVAESLHATVDWNSEIQTVVINFFDGN